MVLDDVRCKFDDLVCGRPVVFEDDVEPCPPARWRLAVPETNRAKLAAGQKVDALVKVGADLVDAHRYSALAASQHTPYASATGKRTSSATAGRLRIVPHLCPTDERNGTAYTLRRPPPSRIVPCPTPTTRNERQ